ncbi:MAG: hypothetical protein K0R17_2031 [Rariglobus sp.]|nr:hypothetical protein [Rariglobus sp.]
MPFRSRFLDNLRKQAWSLLPLPKPDFTTAIHHVRIDEAPLRASYASSPLSQQSNTFVLYRIIGNDLPPRHREGQSLANLRFILENEPALAHCEKRWVVNRITDSAQEAAVLALLAQHNQPVLHLPFVADEYIRLGLDLTCLPSPDYFSSQRFSQLSQKKKNRLLGAAHRLKNLYVMNNNGARNAALADGRPRAKWVLPFDGNCFFTTTAWGRLVADVTARPWLKYFAVPMARLLDNQRLFDPNFVPPAKEEPQLLFRRDAAESFHPDFPYGRRPKVELFWRLGIPGPWDLWTESAWDIPRRPLSPEAYQFGAAGWVARLFSGVPHLEIEGRGIPSQRGVARQEAILTLFQTLDQTYGSPSSSASQPASTPP